MSGQIFISYRRSDSLGSTGRLYDRLLEKFAPEQIFMDVDTISPGVDFVEAIEQAVSKCDVLIAVIGAGWLQSSDNQGRRRLQDPDDLVRLEIGTALKRKIRVIPVLIENALMPSASDLPDELKPLSRRNALELSHTRYKADIERLINTLALALEQAKVQNPPGEEAKAEHITTKDADTPHMAVSEVMPVVQAQEKGLTSRQAAQQTEPKQIVTEKPGRVLFSCIAHKQWLNYLHPNCKFIVRTTDIEFVDPKQPSFSFKVPIEKLRGAAFTQPKSSDVKHGLLIILRDGTEYEFGLNDINKERALEAINKLLKA